MEITSVGSKQVPIESIIPRENPNIDATVERKPRVEIDHAENNEVLRIPVTIHEVQVREQKQQRKVKKKETEKIEAKVPVTFHSCTDCSMKFQDQLDLRLHMNNIHNKDTVFVKDCEFCNKKFKTLAGYDMHKDRYHTNRQSYPICPTCGKSFASQSSLETHMITHSDTKAFTCADCNKSFKFKGTLKQHRCDKK